MACAVGVLSPSVSRRCRHVAVACCGVGVAWMPPSYRSKDIDPTPAIDVVWRAGVAALGRIEYERPSYSRQSRLAVSWCRKLGIADHSSAIAPAICGVAMDVPLTVRI